MWRSRRWTSERERLESLRVPEKVDEPQAAPFPVAPFVEYLQGNLRRRPGAMIDIKRCTGREYKNAAPAWPYLAAWCQGKHWWSDQVHLLVATCYAQHQISWVHPEDPAEERWSNLGASAARLRARSSPEQKARLDHLMIRLISADRNMIGTPLVQLIQRLAESPVPVPVPVEWTALLDDLKHWWQEGPVARDWARAYRFGVTTPTSPTSSDEESS
jgi:CRISPR type I-E-associated protein CasB/Cse2